MLDISPSQVLSYTSPTQAPYAPSPSLLGTNDPLGRTGCRAPIVSFGFGGKFVVCNHGSNTLNTGFDVALSSRQTTSVEIRVLHTIIPESAIESSATSFPGPLFCDPGTPSTSLVRTGTSNQVKNNKAKVVKYLEDRAEEASRGIGYLTQGTPARKEAEGKLVLIRLLKVLVENDGQLSGSPQIEAAVRSVLVPRLDETSKVNGMNTLPSGSDLAFNTLGLGAGDLNDVVLATTTVKTSALDRIRDFLIRGDRRGAYHYALDERLWAHAMVIASSIDKEAWKEVVNEFVKTEVGASTTGKESGRESLKAAYTLYSGQGASAVNSLAAPTTLAKLTDGLRPAIPHTAPTSPNLHALSPPSPVSVETLAKWPETVAMMLGGPSQAECSTALLSLGDCLLANQWPEAAHVCYLLAPQTPVLSSIGSTSGRVALLGSRGPLAVPNFHVEHDSIIFSEIVEFAMSLSPMSKGQETFHGFPHLQAFKLIRAASLAEMGHIQAANRYCEAIASSLGRSAGFPGPDFVEQLKELSDRLIGVPQLDKTGSWKLNKPSLDKIGSWLEGSLTKFIAGDGEATTAESQDVTPQERTPFSGPFTHFSTISSAASSKPSSPQPTAQNPHILADAYPAAPRRTGSAHSMRPLMNPHAHIDRASSAMDYRPRNSSPGPRIVSASATTTSFAQSASYYRGMPNGLQSVPDGDDDDNAQTAVGVAPQGVWWGSATEETSSVTPTAATFYQVDQAPSPSTSGFVSLMDDTSFGAPSFSSSSNPTPTYNRLDIDDDDDLGLGNSASKRAATTNGEGSHSESKATQANDVPTRPDAKPVQGSSAGRSWLNPIGWWKGSGSGPIKATLGEESSFVYDAELKRWVNKKSGGEPAKPATPPPPPSRAQTASPGHSAPRMPNGTSPAPPPARAASAVDLTASPPKRAIPRMRSNLVPVETSLPLPPSRANSPGLAPPTPHGGLSVPGTPPPTPGRPKSQASKRNIRSRYVDVFQQPIEGS
ncbi:Sec23-binding domain of Sec16-domain-containing protein [Amylostereum chailletii]|nr:Sec23-binding domain of Sec16-domain-containing protein [Amylostereum chailletii]